MARDDAQVMGEGLPFLRGKARQYGLIQPLRFDALQPAREIAGEAGGAQGSTLPTSCGNGEARPRPLKASAAAPIAVPSALVLR